MRELAVNKSSRILNEVPVFTIEIVPIPALVAASDVLAVNVHPFYRRDLQNAADPEVMANRILEATAHQIDFYRNLAPEKQIVVTEIGWPTESAPNDVGVGDPEVSYRFLQVILILCVLSLLSWFRNLCGIVQSKVYSIIGSNYLILSGRSLHFLNNPSRYLNFIGVFIKVIEKLSNFQTMPIVEGNLLVFFCQFSLWCESREVNGSL